MLNVKQVLSIDIWTMGDNTFFLTFIYYLQWHYISSIIKICEVIIKNELSLLCNHVVSKTEAILYTLKHLNFIFYHIYIVKNNNLIYSLSKQ